MSLGADPELFLQENGKIIGSERVIPDGKGYGIFVVRDGIQVELNPIPSGYGDRSSFQTSVAYAFHSLNTILMSYPNVSVCWDTLVEVDQSELDALSPETRLLGCQPSQNTYGEFPITVDPLTYRKRSAG